MTLLSKLRDKRDGAQMKLGEAKARLAEALRADNEAFAAWLEAEEAYQLAAQAELAAQEKP